MLQDIEPRVFDNAWSHKEAKPEDFFFAYREEGVLVKDNTANLWYPSFADYSIDAEGRRKARFLFSIDGYNYFLMADSIEPLPGWLYSSIGRFRQESRIWRAFAGALGWQLYNWYSDHVHCSRCGELLLDSEKERMLYCPACEFTVYPTIHPCVIVGVYDGDKLLLTKYANRLQSRYALVAGFNEVGESLEDTVRREVFEEVGLKVKNIRFYKSQPWPFSDSLLAGFYAELDGGNDIRLDEEELAAGVWLARGEIPPPASTISLTGEMIEMFRTGMV